MRSAVKNTALAGVVALGLTLILAVPTSYAIWADAVPYLEVARVFPGTFVSVTATALHAIAEIASVVSVGALLLILFLKPYPHRRVTMLERGVDLTVLKTASGLWALTTGLLILFDALDTSGVPLEMLGTPGAVDYVLSAASNFEPLITRFLFACAVAITAALARRWTTLVFALWAAALGTVTPIVVGQVLVGPNHDLGSDAAILQAAAAYPLLGAFIVLAIQHLAGDEVPEVTRRRFRRVALVAVPVIIVTDAVITWFKLAGTPVLGSVTGWFMVGRWAGLALILVAVSMLWRGAKPGGWMLGLGTAGAALWAAFSVAMTREPPPQFFVDTTPTEVFLGFNVDAAPTFAVLMTHWHPNLLMTSVALIGLTLYFGALHFARTKGVKWPIGKTISWVLGWALFIFVTNSGIGKYSAPHFGIHMLMHMTLNMAVPILLAMGGFITLLLRASRADGDVNGLRQWITALMGWRLMKLVYNPLVVFAAFVASFYALYFTGLFELLMTYHWGHQFMNLHFLIVGFLYYSLIIGTDRTPHTLPHIARLGLAMAVMPFHAFFGVILMNNETIIAVDYYVRLALPWMNLPAAQEMGGAVAWAGGEIPALLVVIALGIQWARQDKVEAKRRDRHIDSGRDAEYEEYNKMLERLGQRGGDR